MATEQQVRDIYETSLHGNHLALDFVNSVDWRLAPQRQDLLVDHEVLLHWGRRLGLVSESELRQGLEKGSGRRRGTRALERSVELRELLYDIFATIAADGAPSDDKLHALTAIYSEAVAEADPVVSLEEGYRWSWARSDPLERIRWAVCAAGVELLFSDALARVKQCRDEGCGWVFLDKSKNASRRWCSMDGCGARAKMRRQYRRKKSQAAG